MQFLRAKIEKPLSYLSCGQFVSDGPWIHERRVIESFEVIIGLKGTAYIQQDDVKYEVRSGDVLLLLPGHIHLGYSVSETNASFYWLHFLIRDQFELLEQKEAYSVISPLKTNPYTSRLNESIIVPVFSSLENMEKLHVLFKQLLHISTSTYYTTYAVDFLINLILIEISQQVINSAFKNSEGAGPAGAKLNNILEWIRINIKKDISVEEISERFNFNKDYLSRMFKKHIGVGIVRYVNGMRVLMAKELLCQPDPSIKEIAYSVGFKDEKYFMKLFKEYENITPSEFRNTYYQTKLNNK